jgi:TolB-like protein/DNA-binding winged helix-turn-helix (wHTH) protein
MKTDPVPGTRVRFGTFEADLRSGELHRDGLKVKIQELPFQVLVLLLERPGEVVTREDLRSRLWPADTFVDFEQGLNKAINKLREALGDDANNPRFVETLTRRGYRFIGPVEAVAGPQVGRRNAVRVIVFGTAVFVAALGAFLALNVAGLRNRVKRVLGVTREPPLQIHSIAVLPLENLSHDPEEEYFAEGMTDELITELSKISVLRVISRTSTMAYRGSKKPLREIARELNIDAVVEGTVQRAGGQVRINAQLVDTSTDRNLWAASYERDSKNVLSLQRDVAEAIAEKIQARTTPQEKQLLQPAQTLDPAAYDAFLRGRYLIDRRIAADAPRSTQYFRQAIGLDSGYALAYAGLADSLVLQSVMETARPDDVMPQARAAAQHALQLNPDLGEAYTVLGEVKRIYEANWKAAEEDFKRGIELNPSDPFTEINYAYCLADLGRLREAVDHAQRALELDPVSFYANRTLASMLYFARRYDAALAQFQRTRDLHGNPGGIENWVARIYEKKGVFDKAIRADLSSIGGPAADLDFYRAAYSRSGWRGYWQARIERLLPRADQGCAAYDLSLGYMRLGDPDKAFHWLNRSIDRHCVSALHALVDPQMDAIRSDPRFPALLRRMNLPPGGTEATR